MFDISQQMATALFGAGIVLSLGIGLLGEFLAFRSK